ncbi:MAG: hypothetical protein CMO12_03695 [Thaumarchaeota archaeon]|nr:hypothetical protein [Nitrososphaerota archaeon]|tara:strand:+ start:307 stop:1164 length:858 start_codon:yes stop_codon:yes gene_type:complete
MQEPENNQVSLSNTNENKQSGRQHLLKFIEQHGPVSLKAIREGTGMSVGSIYYHLDRLHDYIGKDVDGLYILTALGRDFQHGGAPPPRTIMQIADLLALGPLLRFASAASSTSLLTVITVLQLGFFAHVGTREVQILLVTSQNSILQPALSPIVGGWLGTFLFVQLLSGLITRQSSRQVRPLMASIAIALLPQFATTLLISRLSPEISIIRAVIQIWSIAILSEGMASATGVRKITGLLIAVSVLNFSVGIVALLDMSLVIAAITLGIAMLAMTTGILGESRTGS